MKIRDRIIDLRRVKASELLPNPKNWRIHPEGQQEAMRGILAEVGIADALLARETPEGLQLIDGHLRADVASDGVWPVLVLDVDEAEADKILATHDPLAAMAEADAEKLEELLAEVSTGSEALAGMLSDLADDAGLIDTPEIIEDEIPEPPKYPVTNVGDLWLLGEHRLLCGDSTKAEDVARVMDRSDVASLISDPPYGIDHDVNYERFTQGGTLCGKAKQRNWKTPIVGDGQPFNPAPLLKYGRVILCGANCYSDKLPCGSWLVWVKKREVNLGQFMSDAEVVWMNHGHGVYVWFHEWDGFNKSSERGQARLHPTQKPVALMARLIEWANIREGDFIYDPFLGSGTTLIAAQQMNRRCVGLEISPQYCDATIDRWEALTGGKAKRG